MSQHNNTTAFAPAQTPLASEIQNAAVWVECLGLGQPPDCDEMIVLRDTLLYLAGRVEGVARFLIDTLFSAQERAELTAGQSSN